jgi:hypothetical protein
MLARIAILTGAALLMSASIAVADFGAIAYSPNTKAYGYSHGFDTQADAENDALRRCSGSDKKILVWVENGWASLAVGDDGYYGWGWSTNSLADADNTALTECAKRTTNGRIVVHLYSGE